MIISHILVYLDSFINSDGTIDRKTEAEELYVKKDVDPESIKLLSKHIYHNIITSEYLSELILSDSEVLVYFFKPNCMNCSTMVPYVNTSANVKNLITYQFNLLEFPNERVNYNIVSTPTLILFDEGVEVDRLVGFKNEVEVKNFLDKVTVK